MNHAWVQEPLCHVVDTTWYREINIKIKDIEERLKNNNSNKTILKEIEKELLTIIEKIDQKNGWYIEETYEYKNVNVVDEANKLNLSIQHKTKISNKFIAE